MTEHDDALSLDMVTAALRADSTDVAIYARVLTQSLGEALPSECVTVDRERSVSDRMRGRPGEISRIAVQLGDQQMTLSVRNGRAVAEICRAVRGVVLSRQTVPVHEWAAALASALVAYAEQNAEAAQALRRLVAGSLSGSGAAAEPRRTSPGPAAQQGRRSWSGPQMPTGGVGGPLGGAPASPVQHSRLFLAHQFEKLVIIWEDLGIGEHKCHMGPQMLPDAKILPGNPERNAPQRAQVSQNSPVTDLRRG